MNIILLSGGSGKRLWPLSNDVRSKQFLKVLIDENGKRQSMLQRVYKQIKTAFPEASVTIATSASQTDIIRDQLGDAVDIVSEPERRDTFPAIALACAYLVMEKGVSKDETVTVLPVDPYTEISFFRSLDNLERIVKAGLTDIALMGILPIIPTSKYGYIIPGNKISDNAYTVSKFVEKPNEDYAAELIRQNAYWNCGVFTFKLGYITGMIPQFKTFADIMKRYGELEKTSFDYAVAEKSTSSVVVSYNGMWADLGTWRILTDEMPDNVIGDAIVEDCENTYVINEANIPLIVYGVKNLIVAASSDGILVSDLAKSSKMKPLVEKIETRENNR